MREGTPLFAAEDRRVVGRVTSGGFGPRSSAPIAMGYLPPPLPPGTTVYGEVRGKRLPATVTAMPFRPPPTNADPEGQREGR
jgi:aminomethyltransferase